MNRRLGPEARLRHPLLAAEVAGGLPLETLIPGVAMLYVTEATGRRAPALGRDRSSQSRSRRKKS